MPTLLPYGETKEYVFRFSSTSFNLGDIINEDEALALCNDQTEFEELPSIFS